MAIWDFLFGKQEKYEQQPGLFPGQENFLNNLYSSGGGLAGNPLYGAGSDFLQKLLKNGAPELEAPLMANFNQNTAPGIANRYAGMGTGAGALSSSGLNNALAQAGSGLQRDIGALRFGTQMQGLGQALQYAQQPISNQLQGLGTRPVTNFRPSTGGLLEQLIAALMQAGGRGGF